MARDQLLLVIDLKQCVACMELQLLTHILVWHRVMVPLIADVIVDVDLDRFDGDIALGMHRQWSQCRAVQLLKCVTSVTGQLLERTLVEFVQQGTDALVEFGKREEGLMA